VLLNSQTAWQVCEFLQFIDAVYVYDLAASIELNFDHTV